MSHRSLFVNHALTRLGDTVLWGDLDCSELVARAFKEAGGDDWSASHNAQRLHDEASRPLVDTEKPLPGDLTFHGFTDLVSKKLHVVHVGIWLVGGKVLSADGATPAIKTLAEAEAHHARVRVHETIFYRPDLPYLAVHRFTALDDLEGVTR